MRIVHLSDTHLGFSAYSRIDPDLSVNQREADIYDAFRQAVDRAIELKPDAVIHAGDLFDKVHPQNRAIDFALRQLIRLSDAGMDVILISGNHSTPRLRETGNIFSIFEHLPRIHPVFEPRGRALVIGDMTVTAVPHSASPPLADIVRSLKPSRETGKNVLVLHAGLLGSETYRMDEFNEQTIPLSLLSEEWDYVALGHYHEHRKVRDGVCYSGSTERMGFGELGHKKGIVHLDLDSKKIGFEPLDTREMVDLPEIDASGWTSSEIVKAARDIISSRSIDDKIVRLIVRNIERDAYRSLDIPSIRKLGSSALHFELRTDRREDAEEGVVGDAQIGVLEDEFRKYVSSREFPEERKHKLLAMGEPYFARGEE